MPGFHEYFKNLYESRNITKAKLSRLSKVSEATLSRIESGTQLPSPKTLKKLAPHLMVSEKELMIKAGYLSEEENNQTSRKENHMSEQKNTSLNGQCSDRQLQTGLIQQLTNNNGVVKVLDSRIIPLLRQIDQKLDLLLLCMSHENQLFAEVVLGSGVSSQLKESLIETYAARVEHENRHLKARKT